MARQPINHGTTVGDGTGETLFTAFDKVNANDAELFEGKTETYANLVAFPVTGVLNKTYIAADTDVSYVWDTTTGTYLPSFGSYANKAAILAAPGIAGRLYVQRDTGQGWVYVDGAYRLVGWNAAGTAILGPDGLPIVTGLQPDANGYYVANIIPRTPTLAGSLLIAGGVNEIGVLTDKNALVRFNGVVGGAKPYYRSKLVGKTTIMAQSVVAAGAAITWNPVSFVDGTVVEDDIGGTANLALSKIVVPAGIDYYEVIYYVPWVEIASATGDKRRVSLTIGGGTPTFPFGAGVANLTVTGSLSMAVQGFYHKQTKVVSSILDVGLATYHDSAAIPNLGIGGNMPWMTVLMYAN